MAKQMRVRRVYSLAELPRPLCGSACAVELALSLLSHARNTMLRLVLALSACGAASSLTLPKLALDTDM